MIPSSISTISTSVSLNINKYTEKRRKGEERKIELSYWNLSGCLSLKIHGIEFNKESTEPMWRKP